MNQSDLILDHLRRHPAGITPLEALSLYGCMRLAARISDIKAQLGPQESIATIAERPDGGTHARYVLVRGNGAVLFENLDDWTRFTDSPHRRHGHREPVPGCEWCIRIAAGDAVWRNAPPPVVTEEAGEPLTLFGEAA